MAATPEASARTSRSTRHELARRSGSGLLATLAADACSEVVDEDVGRDARSAVGVAAPPYGLPVEIEAVVAVE